MSESTWSLYKRDRGSCAAKHDQIRNDLVRKFRLKKLTLNIDRCSPQNYIGPDDLR